LNKGVEKNTTVNSDSKVNTLSLISAEETTSKPGSGDNPAKLRNMDFVKQQEC
jgi:hypothetical protein